MTSPSRVGSHSPASPRLPSPPPFPEVQIGHRSPSPSSVRSSLIATPEDHPSQDYGAARRIRPGTKAADMASGPPLVPLAELDSAFQLQEHLKSLYLSATTSPTSMDLTQPITRSSATFLATPPPGIDRSLWLYELCRFLVQRANTLIVGFFADTPPCSAANCPEMRASEWQYLCAVHDPPKSCCAIDYCCHTLDWAAGVLTSQRHFPSRLTLGSGGKESNAASQAGGGDAASVRQLTNIFRRVYRMFAHAWFQHRDVFWAIENQEGLYVFYKTVCDVYELIPEDNYTVPPEAEGLSESEKQTDEGGWTRENLHGASLSSAFDSETARSSRPSSLDFSRGTTSSVSEDYSTQKNAADSAPVLGTGATTRRHKHTPSTGSFVTTIHEGDEDIPSPAKPSVADSSSISANSKAHPTATNKEELPKQPKTARLIDSDDQDPATDNLKSASPEASKPDYVLSGAEPQSSEQIPEIHIPETNTTDSESDIAVKDPQVPSSSSANVGDGQTLSSTSKASTEPKDTAFETKGDSEAPGKELKQREESEAGKEVKTAESIVEGERSNGKSENKE